MIGNFISPSPFSWAKCPVCGNSVWSKNTFEILKVILKNPLEHIGSKHTCSKCGAKLKLELNNFVGTDMHPMHFVVDES